MVQTKHTAPQTKTLKCPYMAYMVQTKQTAFKTKSYMPYNLSRISRRDGLQKQKKIPTFESCVE